MTVREVCDFEYDETLHADDKCAKLGVDQIDLPILHQPMPHHLETLMEKGDNHDSR